MEPFIQLKNTPIKEIVISASFEENLSDELIDNFKNKFVAATDYIDLGRGFTANFRQEKKGLPQTSIEVDGFIFKNDKNKVVNLRRGRVALHKINGYENFEELKKEFISIFDILLTVVDKDIKLNNLGLRYLNLFEIQKQENIEDVLTISVQSSFEFDTKHKSNIKLIFEKCNEENTSATISTNEIAKDGINGIILDIQTNRAFFDSIFSKNFIEKEMEDLRYLKNTLFFKSVTEKTIEKYK